MARFIQVQRKGSDNPTLVNVDHIREVTIQGNGGFTLVRVGGGAFGVGETWEVEEDYNAIRMQLQRA
jgi:hypothetical protein